ncbi:MAG: hypothetical protein ACK4Z5_00120 [Brevundimonas sp.]|jgi:hypothetical protein
MQQDAIEQLGLSPAATRVLKAHVESSLAGPNFMIGLAVTYFLTAVFWIVGLGIAGWSISIAVKEGSALPLFGAAFALPFLLIPLLLLANMRRLDRARRG